MAHPHHPDRLELLRQKRADAEAAVEEAHETLDVVLAAIEEEERSLPPRERARRRWGLPVIALIAGLPLAKEAAVLGATVLIAAASTAAVDGGHDHVSDDHRARPADVAPGRMYAAPLTTVRIARPSPSPAQRAGAGGSPVPDGPPADVGPPATAEPSSRVPDPNPDPSEPQEPEQADPTPTPTPQPEAPTPTPTPTPPPEVEDPDVRSDPSGDPPAEPTPEPDPDQTTPSP